MSLYIDIEKKLGSFHLKVKLEADNETLALLGASGCGKSLTLKCIAGIETPDHGRVVVDDVVLFDSEKGINLSPQQRRTGLMFQNYALFPNMSVLQNIRCGASREKDKNKRDAAISSVIERFDLTSLISHLPHQLSGGQQQRVALARILVSAPQILLLDEPFSALDSHLRFRLERDVRQVIHDFGKTVVLVSHDRDEVFRMSDRIAVMDKGFIQAAGRKEHVFAHPQTRRAAVLTGCKNISSVERLPDGRIHAADWGLILEASDPSAEISAVGIRMHDLRPAPGRNCFHFRVIEEIENPFSYTIMLQPADSDAVSPLGWELDKKRWEQLRAETLDICLPLDALLLLKE